MSGTDVTYLILFLVCLGLSAFFSSSEIAYMNLQRIRLQHLQESKKPNADRVAAIMEKPERFLSVVLTSVSVTETILVTCGGFLFVSLMGEPVGAPVGIVVIAIVLLLFVKVIPQDNRRPTCRSAGAAVRPYNGGDFKGPDTGRQWPNMDHGQDSPAGGYPYHIRRSADKGRAKHRHYHGPGGRCGR